VGVFGITDTDFPPEVEGKMKDEEAERPAKAEELDEANKQKPT
jgi:hypothetical protein